MEKAMEQLAKLNISEENQKKLMLLLVESKKTGKISSKQLIVTLDAMEASDEQAERFYDILEANGIEIDVTDVLEILSPEALEDGMPTEAELQSLD